MEHYFTTAFTIHAFIICAMIGYSLTQPLIHVPWHFRCTDFRALLFFSSCFVKLARSLKKSSANSVRTRKGAYHKHKTHPKNYWSPTNERYTVYVYIQCCQRLSIDHSHNHCLFTESTITVQFSSILTWIPLHILSLQYLLECLHPSIQWTLFVSSHVSTSWQNNWCQAHAHSSERAASQQHL